MDKKILCIYHAGCADGFGGAWVARKALGNIEFFAASYKRPPPDVVGKDVVIVDFSYPRLVMIEMAKSARSILVLDHHKSAMTDLVDMPDNVTLVFDMGRSGVRIAWDHYFPGVTPPQMLLHVEDRDLWKFSLKKTREIMAAVLSYPYEFEVWDTLIASDVANLVADGIAIERKHFRDIKELLSTNVRRMVVGGYDVPVANVPKHLVSDAAHILAKGEPFSVTYYDTQDTRKFGLRSRDGGIDVSEVAQQYGGGGHWRAAGFELSFSEVEALETVNHLSVFGRDNSSA
jgi:oligoribonuclease NrnB/cAMP/cGMP phosphodiesterase (DHH superfamily)